MVGGGGEPLSISFRVYDRDRGILLYVNATIDGTELPEWVIYKNDVNMLWSSQSPHLK